MLGDRFVCVDNPRVESITYRLQEPSLFSEEIAGMDVDTPDFRGQLAEGTLTLVPKDHFATLDEARALADAFVQTWEISGGLFLGRTGFRFTFETACISGSDPETGKSVDRFVAIVPTVVTATIDCTPPAWAYPPPPDVARAIPEAESIWNRYCKYLNGEEPLQAMAYYCLTVLKRSEPMKEAAHRLSIQIAIMKRLGNLASTRGTQRDARKYHPNCAPLTSDEEAWLRVAVPAIIRHLLVRKPGQKLSMNDIRVEKALVPVSESGLSQPRYFPPTPTTTVTEPGREK